MTENHRDKCIASKARSPPIAEIAYRTAWSSHGQHVDDNYSRRGNFGRSFVHNIVLIYSPDGTNAHGARTTEFEGSGSV